jgi:hypothetical protein
VNGLVSEKSQAKVVPNVGVRQEHAIDRASVHAVGASGPNVVQKIELTADIRRSIDQEDIRPGRWPRQNERQA